MNALGYSTAALAFSMEFVSRCARERDVAHIPSLLIIINLLFLSFPSFPSFFCLGHIVLSILFFLPAFFMLRVLGELTS